MTNLSLKEHDVVKLDSGEIGSIVHIYPNKTTFEVETENKVKTVSLSEITKM